MTNQEILEAVSQEVQKRLTDQGAGHGFDHIARVVESARRINKAVSADSFIVELAALLHDVGDAKFFDGQELSGQFSREILQTYEVAPDVVEHVVHIVENLSFRKQDSADALSLEGQVVQDADRLDALGAIGIVRTIEYGASIGQPFYVPGDRTARSGIRHFDDKLFKLRDLMNTDAGRKLAEQREEFMRTFVRQFESECNLAG